MKPVYFLYILLFYVFRIFPIKRNKIVFSSYLGRGYGDNGKYICNELLKYKDKLDIVWLSNYKNDTFPIGVRKVRYRSIRSIYEQVTAKVWVDNRRKREFVRKRKNQYYIMTWHGGIGPKKVEEEAQNQLSDAYIRSAKRDSKMADLFIAESQWTYDLYRRAFWYGGEILLSGVPREDILFQNNQARVNKIKDKLDIAENTNILLYAPTFRERLEGDLSVYNIEWLSILQALKKRFGGDWIGMIRLHPNIAEASDKLQIPESIINASHYPDMQELLLISTCMITDYSSSIFEFGITSKPAFILAKDMKEYLKERNLALDYTKLPFPVSITNESLLEDIIDFDEKKYHSELYKFYYGYCGLIDGGHASATIANRILEVMNSIKKY